MRVHRAAHVHQQEHAHVRLARRAQHDLELARVLRRLVDGLVEVELELGALAVERAQLAERDLDLPHVEHEVRAVRAVDARVGDRHRAPAAALGPDAHAASGACRCAPKGLVPPVPIQRLPPSWRSFCSRRRSSKRRRSSSRSSVWSAASSSGESSRRIFGSLQPLLELLHELERLALDALEAREERLVERVEVGLACARRARGPRGRSRRASCRAGPSTGRARAPSPPAGRPSPCACAARRGTGRTSVSGESVA